MSQSLARGLQILGRLGDGGQSLDELAEVVGVHKTTVLRLLRTMEAQRFVRRDSDHRFHLGSRLYQLADTTLQQLGVRDIAAPHLRKLSRDTGGQAVHLAVYENHTAVYVDKVESSHSVRMYSRIGLPAPIHCTAVGKVLLASYSAQERDEVIADLDFHSFTANTITDPDMFRRELDRVAEQGWAEDAAEHERFINCIGAPVRDAGDRVIAAASISVPDVILDHDQVHYLLPHLLAATAAIDDDYRNN
jgi:DNA-binding IclR family transcriptional regulator